MGLFKELVELGTKWKVVDKHGLGAGYLYDDELKKRKLDELDRYYLDNLKEGKKDYYQMANDLIKNNKYITKEEKEELFSVLSKIDNSNDSDLVIMLGNELSNVGCKIIFNNYIREILKQLSDVIMTNEKVTSETKKSFLEYDDRINKEDDFTIKKYIIIELLNYLEANKIKVTNREEVINGLEDVNKNYEKAKR